LDDEWTLQETVIDFGLMSGRHDGANIADGFLEVLKQYGLLLKVVYYFQIVGFIFIH
jgi:hypothetical protein